MREGGVGSSVATGSFISASSVIFNPRKKRIRRSSLPISTSYAKVLRARGITVVDDEVLPGTRRFYAEDSWGNRLEFVESEP